MSALFLPTTKKEVERLGWDQLDVIFFSGDAYIDHPSMGAAVISRVLERLGYRVAIVPQPNWQDDLRDFRKLGAPRLFFAVSAGAMDSMVNHYTAARRRRSDDAYTPDARHGARPDYPTIVYTKALKKLFPDTPVIIGGIEASLRRLSHYDYWQDKLLPSILTLSGADMLIYGMGEKPITEIARRLDAGEPIDAIRDVAQTAVITGIEDLPKVKESEHHLILHSFEECLKDKICQADNFKHIEIESNKWVGRDLWQLTGKVVVKVNRTNPPLTTEEVDASFDLPYTRLPHPRYKGKRIPAYEMIRHSVCMHRGCFGGCSFCTISAHQGKFIASRSLHSILREVKQIVEMSDFRGYISDLGGPSANMYQMHGYDLGLCKRCIRPSCLHPKPCPNLNNDHTRLLEVYHAVDALERVKKSFVGSGVRYDLAMHTPKDKEGKENGKVAEVNRRYLEELIARHVSGRLKVAPEHTADATLMMMRKPSFALFEKFQTFFQRINDKYALRQQLIPYFISSHPGCGEEDMAELAVKTKSLDFHLEQVQDFTPTPMTVSTECYYTGVHPYTLQPVFTAKTPQQKSAQRKYFFWYLRENRADIVRSLQRLNRLDLIQSLYPQNSYGTKEKGWNHFDGYSRNRPGKPSSYKNAPKGDGRGKGKRH